MNASPKVRFITLGCKVNQYETQGMREAVRSAGGVPVSNHRVEEQVDFVVVNTCTVTAEADKENHYWIRRMRRKYPEAKIIVTGCGVEKDRARYENSPEVHSILLNHQKAEIADFIPCHSEQLPPSSPPPALRGEEKGGGYMPLQISETEGFGRAFVKIQDGCNHACSFCKVVLVRGRSRSRELQEIIDEVTRLRDSGYREIVFAGIQLGAYGLDFKVGARHASPLRLVSVLKACSKIEGIERLRLSSIEPTDVKPDLIEALSSMPKCCHQLHIPLQSGDNEILKKMNRRYGREFYRDLIRQLREAMADFCLSLDVMAGFPGESETHFHNTVELLNDARPLKCHVFPYSRREGTRAAQYEDVPSAVIRQRVQQLIQCGDELSREVRRNYLGNIVPVLVESYHPQTGLAQGLTGNYLKVYFPGFQDQLGQFVSAKLISLHQDGVMAVGAGFKPAPTSKEE